MDQSAIKKLNDKTLKRLQASAIAISTWADIEPFQVNVHTRYTRDPEVIAAYQMEDIANWAEKLHARLEASSPAKES